MKEFEITQDIFIVGGPEITDARDGCVYLVNLKELILIDTGAGWSVDKIIKNIEKLGFDPGKLSKVLLTHCHIDRIGGVPILLFPFAVWPVACAIKGFLVSGEAGGFLIC
jgi:glyoxylase-like metal-dependent hydrolase (beta-lactamase superfamily II)